MSVFSPSGSIQLLEMERSSRSSSSEPGLNAQIGEVLTGHPHSYIVEQFLQRGSFSDVAKCKSLETNNFVAVKLVRSHHVKAGRREAEMLDELRQLDPDRHNLVKFTEHFIHRSNFCLVFELLDNNLFEFMEKRDFEPLHVCEIRPIAQQTLVALDALKDIGVVHADVKPENIMMVNHQTQPFKVKLTGFGNASKASTLRKENITLNYAYKAPEVLLDHPSLDQGVDIWSLGCVLAFLCLGEELYPFDCEYEAMRMIVQLNGTKAPNRILLASSSRTARFFYLVREVPRNIWWMKSSNQYTLETGNHIMDHCGYSKDFFSLEGLVLNKIKPRSPYLQEDSRKFVKVLEQMLEMNPGSRITPNGALSQDFITMRHLPLRSRHPYVMGTLARMKVCHSEETNGI